MTKQRLLLWIAIAGLLAGVVMPARAANPKETPPKVGQRAGAISALLPVATITRGVGKAAITNQAKKGDELVWNDLVKTEKGGRARITLTDQSILSLGSQAQLKIVKHDDRSQQTALQLYGGRVRAEVSKITRQGGSFELRTPTAVAGVIGTDFGSDASTVGTTVFLCISGIVQVANNDPSVPGSVQCAPGMTTSVTAGKPPTIPEKATPQQIQQLIQDTEPAIISAMSPTSAMPGTTVDASISGTKMGTINAVSVSGAGVTASLAGAPTDTSVTVHLVIAPNADPGPHTITLTKPSGAASAAVFTIMQPPAAVQTGDFKKPYHDLFDQERQSNKAGLTALIASVQQAVDQTLQQLQAANQGNAVDLAPAVNSLNGQVATIQNAINQAGGQVDQAVTSALATFDTQYTAAYNALLQRNPSGVPDDAFNQALQAAYNQVNASLGQSFANITSSLNSNVQAATTTVSQVQQTWMTTITAAAIVPPTPKVNNIERSIDAGAAFGTGILSAPDAGSSKGNNGASVVRYAWVLCDSSYKPAQFGVPIAANTPGCNALAGYASTNADFPFATCNLTPSDYIARVTITDSNNQQAAMDVKIHVLAGAYDPPEVRVRNLAAAYATLQVSQFLAFFDETGFSGYQSLAENVRNTFPTLASMNINPRVSQATINCNDAVVRADWVQNYTYQANPNIPFNQSEQLTIGMARQPGKGWFINDFRGDNGTVQGQLPGPAKTDNPQPDMVVTSVFASFAGASSTAGQPVPPGAQSFTAVVSNVGGADLTASTAVRFSLLDANNAALTTADVPLTIPLTTNATQTVTATLNVPATIAIGTPFQVGANVNPGCTVPEAHCDASNSALQQLILGSPIKITQINPLSLLAGGPPQTLDINVSDKAVVQLNLPPGMTTSSPNPQAMTTAGGGTLSWLVQATLNASPAIPLAPMTVTSNVGIPILQAITYTLTGPTFAQTATPALLSGGPAQAVTVTVNVPGSYTLTLPTGITTTSPNPQTITNASGGSLTWNLQASFTALPGASLQTSVTGGAYTFNVNYSLGVQANFIVQSAAFVGHTPPYVGAQGLQNGENVVLKVVVANVGNASPTGSITLTGSCTGGPPGACGANGNPTGAIAAPAAGTSTTATLPFNNNLPPAVYTGTVVLTTTIPQSSTADDSLSLTFEGVDFNLAVQQPFTGTQNVLLGDAANIFVNLDETGNPTPFPLTITATTDNAGVPITPASATIAPSLLTTTTGGSPGTAVPVTVVYSATNHGVTRNVTQVLNYVSANITSTSLFLNDASNPLEVQMGGTGSTSNPIVTLKLNSTPFGGTANPAIVAAPSPTAGFTATVDNSSTTTASEGGTFQYQVSAAFGAVSTVTSLPVVATLPNSVPKALVSFNLFVKAIGVPDLQIVSVTPPRTFSASTPWLSGEGLDFSVVVKNAGNTASAGNEALTMLLNGFQVDNGTLRVPALAPGASTTIPVHAVAPDLGTAKFNANVTLKTKVDADPAGDLNYVDNSCTGVGACSNGTAAGSAFLSNWHVGVSGAGSGDVGTTTGPLVLTITSVGPWTNQALIVGSIDSGGTTAVTFVPTAGAVGAKLSISGFSQATSPPNSFLATVSASDNATQSGLYAAQVIVQLLDGATVTAQRQATIHVSVNNTLLTSPAYTLGIVCTHNSARCDSGAGTPTPIQVNGALVEQYSVTIVPACTPNPTTGLTCQGTADVVITDGANTTTAPPQVKGLSFNSSAIFQLSADQDANGNIISGPAGAYAISINGIQRSGRTSPDPVGQSVPIPVNVGDINIVANTGANSCTGVVANGTPLQLTATWSVLGGFNVPSVSWQWEDANHTPVGASPISFTSPSGASTFGGGTYSALPTFTLTNTHPQDGLVAYFFSVTVSNGITSATKFFPFFFDVSLNQNFCGAAGGARGFSRVNGTWSRSAAGSGGPLPLAPRLASSAAAAGAVDLHLSATDVSYTPSVPRQGDTVQVRFKVRNDGSSDAKGVPIALQVNGVIVASDTFDVAAGHSTLGGLTWNTANFAAHATPPRTAGARSVLSGRRSGNRPVVDAALEETPAATPRPARLSALLVVDPLHTVAQKTTLEKSVALPHFSLRTAADTAASAARGGSQRVLLEIQDGACAGLRLATGGVGPCGSAEVELTIADIAKGSYTLNAAGGIADLGASFAGVSAPGAARYSSEVAALAGHSYAVQLNGGHTAVATIDSIRNPGQLDAAARALFRNNAVLVLRGLGGSSGAAATGDIAGSAGRGPTVFVQLSVQVQ